VGDVGKLACVNVGERAARRAEHVMVLLERRLVARRDSAEGKDLNQSDFPQDVQRPVDRSEAHAGQVRADALEDRLGREVRPIAERAKHGGALLGQAVARLQ